MLHLYLSLQVAGRIPLPPRYAFGIFYSRYWAYNDIGDMVCVMCEENGVHKHEYNNFLLQIVHSFT